jgi:hypothetical protein
MSPLRRTVEWIREAMTRWTPGFLIGETEVPDKTSILVFDADRVMASFFPLVLPSTHHYFYAPVSFGAYATLPSLYCLVSLPYHQKTDKEAAIGSSMVHNSSQGALLTYRFMWVELPGPFHVPEFRQQS